MIRTADRKASALFGRASLPPAILFTVGLIIHFLTIHLLCCNVTPDSYEYTRLSNNLVAGHGFSLNDAPPFIPSAWRLPVYPLILSALIKVFGTYEYIYHLQAIINTSTFLIVYKIARYLTPKVNPYLIISCILVFSLPLIASSMSLMTEAVNTFLVCATFLFLLRRYYFTAGLFIGIAALCRAENVLVAIALILCLQNFKNSTMFALAISLIIFPWIVRNYYSLNKLTMADPAYLASGMAAGTSEAGVYDPIYQGIYQFIDGRAPVERDAYVAFVRKIYVERWREHPLQIFMLKSKRLVRATLYGLDSFLSEDNWAFGRLMSEHKYLPIALRLITMFLYGPVLLGFAYLGFLHSNGKARILAVHFLVMMALGFVVFIQQRQLIASQFLLIPLFVMGISQRGAASIPIENLRQ